MDKGKQIYIAVVFILSLMSLWFYFLIHVMSPEFALLVINVGYLSCLIMGLVKMRDR